VAARFRTAHIPLAIISGGHRAVGHRTINLPAIARAQTAPGEWQ
jgi:hypothetical protein